MVGRVLGSVLFSIEELLGLTKKLDSGGAIHSRNTELLSIVSDCVYRVVTDKVVSREARERVYTRTVYRINRKYDRGTLNGRTFPAMELF